MALFKTLAKEFANEVKLDILKNVGMVECPSADCVIARDLSVEFLTNTDSEVLQPLKVFKSIQKTDIKSYVYSKSAIDKHTTNPNGFNTPDLSNISLNVSAVSHLEMAMRNKFNKENLLPKKSSQKVLMCISMFASGAVDYPLNNILPMALFCEGKEIIFITKIQDKEKTNRNHIGLTHYKIKFSDVVEMKDERTLSCLNFVGKFQKHHTLKYKCAFTTQCEASYKLLQSENIPGCEAVITCNKVKSVLEFDKQSIFDLKLVITPNITSHDSIAYSLFEEIELLQGYADYFEAGKIQWNESTQSQSVLSNLKQMLSAQGSWQKKNEAEDEQDLQKLSSLFIRTEFDFTECIWQCLKKVNSMQNLIECWRMIFERLAQKGESSSYWLHPNNKTSLAELVRKSYNDDEIQCPAMNGDKPVELLVEIGLEKLTNDYVNYLKKQRLATETKLTQYANKSSSFGSRLKNLRKLHCAMELSLICKQYFNLEYNQLYYKIQTFLESKEASQTITFNIDHEVIEAKIAKLMPYKWTWSMQSNVRNSQMETVCCFLSEDPFLQKENGDDCELNDSLLDMTEIQTDSFDISKYYVFIGSTMAI